MKRGANKSNGSMTDAEGEDEIQRMMHYANAKSLFIGTTLSMSWRLAMTVIIPTVGGVQLDRHFNSAPSMTLAGFFLAVGGAVAVVVSAVKEVNLIQSLEESSSVKDEDKNPNTNQTDLTKQSEDEETAQDNKEEDEERESYHT